MRLNLLPPEIPAARRAKRLLPLCIIPIVLSILGSFGWMMLWKRALTEHEARRDELASIASEVDSIDAEIQAEQQKQEPLRQVLTFLDGVEVHSARYADVIEAVARYIPDTCTIESINVTETSVSFSTVVEDTESLIMLIANLNRCAMPMEGGGSEPLWTADTVSAGPLKPLFSGPVTVEAVNLQGLRIEESVYPDQDIRAQLFSFGPAATTGPAPGAGGIVYRDGLLWEAPIPVQVTATLAEPIALPVPVSAAPADAAAAGGGAMMGAPAMGAAPAAGMSGEEEVEAGGGGGETAEE